MDGLRARCVELGVSPRVWYRIPGYIVRNYSPDLEESVLHHMMSYYINTAPFCRSRALISFTLKHLMQSKSERRTYIMDGLRDQCWNLGSMPRIWYRIPGYIVRNYSPDLEESVLYHMITHFIKEEPFCSSSKVYEDPKSVEEMRGWWQKTIKSNLTVICLPEGAPGADLEPVKGIVRLAGLNILYLASKDDPPKKPLEEEFFGVNSRKALKPFYTINKMMDFYSKYNVDYFMDAAGFSVHPEERGKGLGAALLNARLEICRELGVTVTKTVFSSIPAQIVALRCGFESLIEIVYGEFKDENGQLLLPNLPPERKALLTVKIIPKKN